MRITAVIPNWNGARLLERLLPTIAAQTRPFDSVVLVDNGSQDDSLQLAEGAGCAVVRLETNRGFAAAVNAGISVVKTDAVCVLNNDVELESDWLRQTAACLVQPDVAFVAGKTVSCTDPNRIDGTFDALTRGACAARCGSGRMDSAFWSQPRRIQFAPFTATLIRTEVYRSVGGLDEAFESYLEDVDFGLRCASLGYTGRYEPRAVARHLGSATFGPWNPRTIRKISRNQILLLARHYDRKTLVKFGWPIAIGQLLWGLVAARHGVAWAWCQGKAEGVRMFRTWRGPGTSGLRETLLASERELLTVQRETGFDLYWRLYFALTAQSGR